MLSGLEISLDEKWYGGAKTCFFKEGKEPSVADFGHVV